MIDREALAELPARLRDAATYGYMPARVRALLNEAAAALTHAGEGAVPVGFQDRVQPWMMACFGAEISADRLERGDRLLEEVLELLQSGDYPPERVAALTGYVFGRPKGEPVQEAGGVMVTLAAYCLAHGLDMHAAGETELARIWTKVEKIRAKQAAKPTGSALPVTAREGQQSETLAELSKWTFVVQHNPNCPSPWLVRLPAPGKPIDLLPYRNNPWIAPKEETGDILGFGKTFEEAAHAALNGTSTTPPASDEAEFWCRLLGDAIDALDECAGDDEEGWDRQEHARASAEAIRAKYQNRPVSIAAVADEAVEAERRAIIELIENGKEVRVPHDQIHSHGETEIVAMSEEEIIAAIRARSRRDGGWV